MDNLVLQCLVAELRPRLVGWPVFRLHLGGPDVALVLFDDPARSRLLISCSPALARLHLTAVRAQGPKRHPNAFIATASHHLTGAILSSIDKDPADRVVRLRFAAAAGQGKSLVAELIGRSANLLLLDGEDRLIASARKLRSEFRSPVAGVAYQPPPAKGRSDPRELAGSSSDRLRDRARSENRTLEDLLLEACPSLGPLAAREVERRTLAGENLQEALRTWIDRAFEEGESAGVHPGFIYSELPPAEQPLSRPPAAGRFILSPLPLRYPPPGLPRHDYGSLSEAADAFYGRLAQGLEFRSHRDSLGAIARREARRSAEITAKVREDLRGMESAGRFRRYGESILAGLSQAQRRGDAVLVPDPYDAEPSLLAIPIDPTVSLKVNADRYFQKHRKAERGRAVAERRLAEQSRRAERMASLADRVVRADGQEDLASFEEEMRREGIAVGLDRRARGSRRSAEGFEAGVRVYRSREGYEILVGKGARENDRLTFQIAAPDDFWLHASGASGAHVIVRNPRSERSLPEATLRAAAELAAHFSKAGQAGRAQVMVSRRKYVRRARGAPRGSVTVKKHESLVVTPCNPFE